MSTTKKSTKNKSATKRNKKSYQNDQIYNAIFKFNDFKTNDRFKVFPQEAGLGKTTTMIKALADLYKEKPQVKSLVVSPFVEEGKEIAEKINEEAGANIALAVSADNFQERYDEYPIVIITHAEYRIICKDKGKQILFGQGRTNLIIDEELNLLNQYTITEKDITDMKDLFRGTNCLELYGQITSGLLSVAGNTAKKMEIANIPKDENDFYEKLVQLKAKIKEEIKQEQIDDFNRRHKSSRMFQSGAKDITYRHIQMNIDGLRHLYNCDIVRSQLRLSGYDNSIRYFLLKNNILLDASAHFNHMYEVSDQFKVIRNERIIDHSRDILHVGDLNTTKQAIDKMKMKNYISGIADFIEKYRKEKDKILIVGTNAEVDNIKKHYENDDMVSAVNFQFLRGKNEWADYNKCFIIHTPNYNYEYYAFLYSLYSGKELRSLDLTLTKNQYGNMAFKDVELEKTRKTYVASNIYQAVKRINRDRNRRRKSEIYLFIADMDIVNIVKEQLKGTNIAQIDMSQFQFSEKRYAIDTRFWNSYAGKLLMELKTTRVFQEFKKEYYRKFTGYENAQNFNERVIKKIIGFIKKHPSEGTIIKKDNMSTVIEMSDRYIKIDRWSIAVEPKPENSN